MTRSSLLTLALVIATGLTSTARAASIVSLSSPDDLASLQVGDQARIDVTLSGLETGLFIFNLDTRILFPLAQFELVSGPTPSKALGSVFFGPDSIADPQLANFNANSGPISGGGGVIGNFPDATASGVGAIGQNGLYYSFVVKAIATGSGSIRLRPQYPGRQPVLGHRNQFQLRPPAHGPRPDLLYRCRARTHVDRPGGHPRRAGGRLDLEKTHPGGLLTPAAHLTRPSHPDRRAASRQLRRADWGPPVCPDRFGELCRAWAWDDPALIANGIPARISSICVEFTPSAIPARRFTGSILRSWTFAHFARKRARCFCKLVASQ